jgi:hypothetical protein
VLGVLKLSQDAQLRCSYQVRNDCYCFIELVDREKFIAACGNNAHHEFAISNNTRHEDMHGFAQFGTGFVDLEQSLGRCVGDPGCCATIVIDSKLPLKLDRITKVPVTINIYAPRSMADAKGRALGNLQLWLQHPRFLSPEITYYNPQYFRFDETSTVYIGQNTRYWTWHETMRIAIYNYVSDERKPEARDSLNRRRSRQMTTAEP